MTDDLEKLWEQAEDVAELWLSNAEELFPDQLSARELEALEYLRSRNGDPNSDCSEWAGAKDENHHTGIDVAQFLRAKLIFEFMRRLATREFMAVGKIMGPDGFEAIRKIPAAAFSGLNATSQLFHEPNGALVAFAQGHLNALGHQYYDVRTIRQSEIDKAAEKRRHGGRNPKIEGLDDYTRELASIDPEFPGSNMSEAARQLREFVKTKKDILSNSPPEVDDRTYKRSIERVLLSNDKTEGDN